VSRDQPTPPQPRLPGDRAHLERLLDAWSRDPTVKATSGRLRNVVSSLVVVGMIEGIVDESGESRIALKGGRALELRFGLRARASADFDASYRGSLQAVMNGIREASQNGWRGFTGVLGEPQEITRAGVRPPPLRVQLRLIYKGKPFATVPLEISAAEGRSLDQPEVAAIAIALTPVQLPGPEVATFLPMRYQIAQKFHACTEVPVEGSNRRVHDLRDLLLIRELAVRPEDRSRIATACREIFEGRAKHTWPPEIIVWPDWEVTWTRLREREGFDLTIDEAVEQVRAWIAELAST